MLCRKASDSWVCAANAPKEKTFRKAPMEVRLLNANVVYSLSFFLAISVKNSTFVPHFTSYFLPK